MASNQYGGTGMNFNAVNTQPKDAWARAMLQKYGGRTDPIWDYIDQPGYKREMGSGLGNLSSSRSYNKRFRNSGMAPTSFGGGSTGTDPGQRNWATLNRNVDRIVNAAGNLVDYRMESKRVAVAKQNRQNEEFFNNAANTIGSVYGAGQDPYTQAYLNVGNNVAAAQSGNQLKSVQQLAGQVIPPAQNLTASMQAKANTMVPGASQPIRGRKSQSVNLIYPQGNPVLTKKGSRKPSPKSPYSGPQPPAPPRP